MHIEVTRKTVLILTLYGFKKNLFLLNIEEREFRFVYIKHL